MQLRNSCLPHTLSYTLTDKQTDRKTGGQTDSYFELWSSFALILVEFTLIFLGISKGREGCRKQMKLTDGQKTISIE